MTNAFIADGTPAGPNVSDVVVTDGSVVDLVVRDGTNDDAITTDASVGGGAVGEPLQLRYSFDVLCKPPITPG